MFLIQLFLVIYPDHPILPNRIQGRIQDFKLGGGGAHLKESRRADGGAKIFGVFRVKNHDFTTKNHIFSNCGGKRENFWGISCEKSRFNAKKSYFFQFKGGRAPGAPPPPPPGSAPGIGGVAVRVILSSVGDGWFKFW